MIKVHLISSLYSIGLLLLVLGFVRYYIGKNNGKIKSRKGIWIKTIISMMLMILSIYLMYRNQGV